ncbi:hypothetical protein [Paenibacillus alginolyticus]|uniref:Uncharacterized protein n=1 Tax=Paenibacillus alginolyticus TaxID=59839 RepID=A0ABT4GMF6_9BACL|nr:hypothetical protein [Paenibacillus alginolyticus]MCY9697330.1 hypothetical protein [Paenibacillus alginolyticus]MEC0145251.1 hypothetical protein [Paenibacillus alginolyticus]
MNIRKEQFGNLSVEFIKGLPFIERFTIQEYRHPSDEVSSYLITLRRSELISDLDAFILLLERLEYHEEEWNWNEKLVKSCRGTVLNKIFNFINKDGVCAKIDSHTLTKKISEVDIEIDVYREITKESCNFIIFDNWNLLQSVGRNDNTYYLFIWYTTA